MNEIVEMSNTGLTKISEAIATRQAGNNTAQTGQITGVDGNTTGADGNTTGMDGNNSDYDNKLSGRKAINQT